MNVYYFDHRGTWRPALLTVFEGAEEIGPAPGGEPRLAHPCLVLYHGDADRHFEAWAALGRSGDSFVRLHSDGGVGRVGLTGAGAAMVEWHGRPHGFRPDAPIVASMFRADDVPDWSVYERLLQAAPNLRAFFLLLTVRSALGIEGSVPPASIVRIADAAKDEWRTKRCSEQPVEIALDSVASRRWPEPQALTSACEALRRLMQGLEWGTSDSRKRWSDMRKELNHDLIVNRLLMALKAWEKECLGNVSTTPALDHERRLEVQELWSLAHRTGIAVADACEAATCAAVLVDEQPLDKLEPELRQALRSFALQRWQGVEGHAVDEVRLRLEEADVAVRALPVTMGRGGADADLAGIVAPACAACMSLSGALERMPHGLVIS